MVRVWDAQTLQCLEVIQGRGDVAAIAAGASEFPLRALAHVQETVVEQAEDGKPVAWFGTASFEIVTHLSGCTWAGRLVNHLYIITLEGGDKPMTQKGAKKA